jgi:hypothetical protein
MPQFVLLEHDHPELHWDFMLESGDVLLTWRLDRIPAEGCEFDVIGLPDHRKVYLDYEGPVSGNRGSVVRIDRGEFEFVESPDDSLEARLMGPRLRGTARLQKKTSNGSPDESMWRMIWQPDCP